MRTQSLSAMCLFLGLTAGTAFADEATDLVNKADVLREGVTGVSITAVHEVTDTAGKVQKQVYSVLNHVPSGASFIVLSSESSDVNGTVFLIKAGTLYAAAPNQRSFVRLGGLNLDRRISGSLFSHWDLQGNVLVGQEYKATIAKTEGSLVTVDLAPNKDAHYARISAVVDKKTGLYQSMTINDAKGALKVVSYTKPKQMGTKVKKRVPTVVEMKRADGRSDLPVAKTTFKVYEVEFDPAVDYGEAFAVSDANLQRLRSRHVLSAEAFRSLLAEVTD
jgi:outer membrane lipoprotein-sorting protein